MIEELVSAAKEIHAQRYAGSEVVFLAGSLVRGEGTPTSDLDLVVVFRELKCAYRESFVFDHWPVEAFVHDPHTLRYFFEDVDRASGVPSLPAMVNEGIEIPGASDFSHSIKALAKSVLAAGPPVWGRSEIDGSRYAITNVLDDLREPRSRAEQIASATVLYGLLADHYLRSRRLWSGKDKTIPRRLRQVDARFAERFEECFQELFATGDSARTIGLAEDVLKNDGGRLFEGYTSSAPSAWRRTP